MDNNTVYPNDIDLEKGQSSDVAVLHPIGIGSNHCGTTESIEESSDGGSNNYHSFSDNVNENEQYQSILGGKFCCLFKLTGTVRIKLINSLGILSALFTLGVVCGLIYYADQVNIDYFPPGLTYAAYIAIIFSAIIGPVLSFLLSCAITCDKRNISEMSPILLGNSRGNTRLCCCGKSMIEFYPVKYLNTIIVTYILGTLILGLIILLHIVNFHG